MVFSQIKSTNTIPIAANVVFLLPAGYSLAFVKIIAGQAINFLGDIDDKRQVFGFTVFHVVALSQYLSRVPSTGENNHCKNYYG